MINVCMYVVYMYVLLFTIHESIKAMEHHETSVAVGIGSGSGTVSGSVRLRGSVSYLGIRIRIPADIRGRRSVPLYLGGGMIIELFYQ